MHTHLCATCTSYLIKSSTIRNVFLLERKRQYTLT